MATSNHTSYNSGTSKQAGSASPLPLRPKRKNALQGRLNDIVLLELTNDGGREYHTMTLRGLYDYVVQAIISVGKQKDKTGRSILPHVPVSRSRQASASDLDEVPEFLPPANLAPITENKVLEQPVESPKHEEEDQDSLRKKRRAMQKNPTVRSILSDEQNIQPSKSGGEESNDTGDGSGNKHAVTLRERLGGYLHPRDMRRLVTPFSASNEPELMVRRHVMLLNFDPLRAICLRDRLLVLVPDGADSILIHLEKRVRGGLEELEHQFFGENSSHMTEVTNSATNQKEYIPTTLLDGLDVVEKYDSEHQKSKRSNETPKSLNEDDKDLSFHDDKKDVDNSDLSFDGDDDDQGGDKDENIDLKEDTVEVSSNNSATTVYSEWEIRNEWDEFKGKDWIEMTFELQSVDAVLASVVKMLSDDSLSLRKKIFQVMEELRGDTASSVPGDHVQEQLRILKDKVREMEGRVQGFVRAMNQILDDEKDMALMNLSRLISHPDKFIQPVPQEVLNEESDEPELILEVYLQQAVSEMNALVLLKGNIVNTEELVSLKMDTIRNRLLYINTVLAAISLSVAVASLIGSIFGMNLTNHIETDPTAFRTVVICTLVGVIFILIGILVFIERTGVMPASPRKVLYSRTNVDVEMRQAMSRRNVNNFSSRNLLSGGR